MSTSPSILAPALLLLGFAPGGHAGEEGLLLSGGEIVVDAEGTRVEALLVRDGVVLAAGGVTEVSARPEAREARRIDLAGGTCLPGPVLAAIDLEALACGFVELDLEPVNTADELSRRLALAVLRAPPGGWIVGRNLRRPLWQTLERDRAQVVADAGAGVRIALVCADGDGIVANADALQAAGIGSTAPPPGARFGDGERPPAVLLGPAATGMREKLPAPTEHDRRARLLAVLEQLTALGWTGLHAFRVGPSLFEDLRALDAQGKLPLRIACYLDGEAFVETTAPPAASTEPAHPRGGRLVLAGLVLTLDGPPGAASAAAQPGEFLALEPARGAMLARAAELGLQPVLEAHGEAAVRAALTDFTRLAALEERIADLAPRILGAEGAAPREWPRFPALGVLPTLPVPFEVAGNSREARTARTWRELSAEVAVASRAPRLAGALPAAAAVLAQLAAEDEADEEGESSAAERRARALRALVLGPALAERAAERRGGLFPGADADLVVFPFDPFSEKPPVEAPAPTWVFVGGRAVVSPAAGLR